MVQPFPSPVVHLELHTGDLARACDEVSRIRETTERARRLGARVLLEPREGPFGWRSVVAVADEAEIAFSQIPVGAATRTEPSAGTRVGRGTSVTVFVSSGPVTEPPDGNGGVD